MSNLKSIIIKSTIATLLVVILSISGYVWLKYNESKKPSPFHEAFISLGFNKPREIVSREAKVYVVRSYSIEDQEEALLRIFHLGGYLKPETIWADINRMGGFPKAEEIYYQIIPEIIKAGGHQEDPEKFNAKLLRKNLFKNTDLSNQDIMDWILFASQHAYEIKKLNEKLFDESSLEAKDLEKKNNYLFVATPLGLLERVLPKQIRYHEAWILGGSRPKYLSRLIDFLSFIRNGKLEISGDIVSIADSTRELSAETDGISPDTLAMLQKAMEEGEALDDFNLKLSGYDQTSIKEGKEYIMNAGFRAGLRINLDKPFWVCEPNLCPVRRTPGMQYLNYSIGEDEFLSESFMALDNIRSIAKPHLRQLKIPEEVINYENLIVDNYKQAALKFVDKVQNTRYESNDEFRIILISNNPFIETEGIIAQNMIDEVLKERNISDKYKIIVESTGFNNKCKLSVPQIQLSKLIELMHKELPNKSTRDYADLLDETRDKRDSQIVFGRAPDFRTIEIKNDRLKTYFDLNLE